MLRTHYPSEPLYELGVHLYGFEQVFTRGSAVLSNRGCELFSDEKRESVVASQHAPRYAGSRTSVGRRQTRFGK